MMDIVGPWPLPTEQLSLCRANISIGLRVDSPPGACGYVGRYRAP